MDSLAKIGSNGDTALAANALCQNCGVCCDGSLFTAVTAYNYEIKKIEKAGVDV